MVYLTNVFVNKMLRNKIDAEMLKFKTVESAFKTIKTATVFFLSLRVYLMRKVLLANISIRKLFMENCLEKLPTTKG